MKKTLGIIFTSLVLLFSANAESLFNWDIALSTGIPVHSSTTDETKSDLLLSNSFNRVITGFDADMVYNFSDPLKFFIGTDTFCEFIWEKGNHFNSLDYSFYAGIKLFPNLAGFNMSVAYVIGSKANFYKTVETSNTSENTKWGNGFRVSLEYDFFHGEEATIYPIVGGYYRFMPRGNFSYDHILAAYAGIRF